MTQILNAQMMQKKRKGAYFLVEIAIFLIFVAIITSTSMGSISDTDGAKIATTHQELDQIRTAVMQYKTYRLDNTVPDNLGDLIKNPCIASEDAIDAREHPAFLQETARWSTSGLKDMWNNNYTIETDTDGSMVLQSTAGSSDTAKYVKVKL